jgi:hypothetical protein
VGLVVPLEVLVVQPFIKRPLLYCALIYRVLEGRVQTRVGKADASRDDYTLWSLQRRVAHSFTAFTRSITYEIDLRTPS